jgi:membrane-associated phospholipid phosphatase
MRRRRPLLAAAVRKSRWRTDMSDWTMIRDETEARADSLRRAAGLAAVAVVAAGGFAALAQAVARRETAPVDEAVRRRTAAPDDHPARDVAEAAAPVGKWWTYVPGALAASAYLLAAPEDREERRRPRAFGAGAVVLASLVATGLNPAFDHLLPQPPAPPGHESRRKPVFPSGHAFGPATVGLAAAYVLARERLARGGIAIPAALALPLATTAGRVLQEKHWASDVLGGYLGGIAVATACLAAYEAAGGPLAPG